jgi:hypothetical protein
MIVAVVDSMMYTDVRLSVMFVALEKQRTFTQKSPEAKITSCFQGFCFLRAVSKKMPCKQDGIWLLRR